MNGKTKLKSEAGKPKLVVPPKLLMAIEKDKTLKDRLKRYNLPIKGTRQVDNTLSRELMPGETVRVTLSSSVLISKYDSNISLLHALAILANHAGKGSLDLMDRLLL